MPEKHLHKWIFTGLFVLLLSTGCEQEKQGYTLKERILISRMVQDSVVLLYPEVDSLCELHFSERVDKMVDSLLPIRLRKMIVERERELRKRGEQ